MAKSTPKLPVHPQDTCHSTAPICGTSLPCLATQLPNSTQHSAHNWREPVASQKRRRGEKLCLVADPCRRCCCQSTRKQPKRAGASVLKPMSDCKWLVLLQESAADQQQASKPCRRNGTQRPLPKTTQAGKTKWPQLEPDLR